MLFVCWENTLDLCQIKKNTHTILGLGYIMDIFFVKHWHFIDSILYDSIREHIIIVNYYLLLLLQNKYFRILSKPKNCGQQQNM